MTKKILVLLFSLLALFVCYQVEHSVYRNQIKTYGDYVEKVKKQETETWKVSSNNKTAFVSENKKEIAAKDDSEPDVKKIAYLTFDDGPSDVTKSIMETLDTYEVKATFFLIASEITEEREEIVKTLIEKGHTVGIHTYSHRRKEIYASSDSCIEDFEKAYEKIYRLTEIKPTIYRFPYGSQNRSLRGIGKDVMNAMKEMGLTYYDWNVDSRDFEGKPSEYSILKNISNFHNYNEPVIIMHDSKSNKITAKVLPQVIEKIKAAGYEFGTLENRTEPCQCPHDWEK